LQSVALGVLATMKRELQLKELEAARDAAVDALVAVYHSDHRELCAHERDWPFRTRNILELVGESMGLGEDDVYKRPKVMQDADAILADCRDLIAEHRLNPEEARDIVVKRLLADQPLPLRGSCIDAAHPAADGGRAVVAAGPRPRRPQLTGRSGQQRTRPWGVDRQPGAG
jgi:heterodisulfide reductase subunit D